MAQRLDIQYIRLYTDGSAARKVETKMPLKTMKLPRIKNIKKIVLHIDPVAVSATVMAVVMVALMITGTVQLNEKKQQLQQMTSYVDDLRTENAMLSERFENSYNIDEVERTALALGLVPADQVKQVVLRAPENAVENKPSTWEQFYAFLAGLFA